MIPIWQLTRNQYTRTLYDVAAAAGVTATSMVEFVATVESASPASAPTDVDSSGDVSIVAAPVTDDLPRRLDLDFSIPVTYVDGEWVVVALADDEAIGRALVSDGQRPYVDPLRSTVAFDGAYLRRVYVARPWRNNGIAKRLIREGLGVARDELGAASASALIAIDNKPSQWAFEACGFRPVRRRDYVSVFGLDYRRVTEHPNGGGP